MSVTWRPPDREDRQVAALWAFCAGLVVVFRPLWLGCAHLAPVCRWHAWTGWPCPGCGTTRAIVRLLQADFAGALRVNPLATCAAVVFVVVGLAAPVWLTFGGRALCLPSRMRPAWIATLTAVVLSNWAWLCASGV